MTWLFIALGFLLLAGGGEILVRGAVGAARAFNVSPLLIGLTLVGFGTSTPELTTSLLAAFEGAPGIAVGNVVGSNIANILLILGAAAMVRALAITPQAYRRDGVVLAASTAVCAAAIFAGTLERWLGLILVVLLVAYIVRAYFTERAEAGPEAEVHLHIAEDARPGPRKVWLSLLAALGGVALTVLGARLLVTGAVDLARDLGISEAVIGLTIVAVGTSLPELVATLVAAARRHCDVALGGVIGSNIYNVLGILGITAAVRPIPVPAQIAQLDVWVLIAASLLLLLFLRTGWTLKRWEGAVFLVAYAGYVGFLFAQQGMI
ncbi:MAG: calcium/sodium antiporter [Phenylobacterium sp.]|uniref:calcium/sodium antiporter n=1 Tax=Phenylobacterium sp. TaxID=1871053 RepID=UPI00391C34CF